MHAVELFAGAGGLGMGVSKAGFSPVQIVEWDRWCCDTINTNRIRKISPVANWPEPTFGDVRPVAFTHLEGEVDLVSGGPPCQPFSLGGKHKAFDDKRDMWPEAVRAVREIRPKAFIFENVKGMTRASFATYFSYIVLQLHHPAIKRGAEETWENHFARLEQHHTSDGRKAPEYKVVSRVLNGADFGVPQKRERVFFVGFRSDLKIAWQFPNGTHDRDALLWDKFRSGEYWDRHEVAVDDRIILPGEQRRAMSIASKPTTKPWRTVRDAISKFPEPSTERDCAIYSNHRLQPGAKAYKGHTGSHIDQPAKTLKAGVHGVPGGENMLRLPNGDVRYFSVRESAALQTFPDNYDLNGSWSEAMRQIGNAVPVDLAATIANAVKEKLYPQNGRN